jgi:hypothetical protein
MTNIATLAPKCNADKAIAFLQAFDPTGWHNLVFAMPDSQGGIRAKTFAPGQWGEMRTWINRENSLGRNGYFTVNEPAPGAPDKKLEKTDIARLRALFVDADPKGGADKLEPERKRLLDLAASVQRGDYPPTFTLDTGGGVQMFWRLAEKLPASEYMTWAEEHGRGLAVAVGGDAVQNIDRIMRLPGTVNIPDAKKRAKGRQKAEARLLYSTQAAYTHARISATIAPRKAGLAHRNQRHGHSPHRQGHPRE